MFIGRKEDLQFLEKQYTSEKFSFIPIYGRRRVGKTTLIQEHIRTKPAIYFQAFELKAQINLEKFSQEVNKVIFAEMGLSLPSYASINEMFLALTNFAKTNQFVLVIDEYPYLAKVIPEVSSLLQYYIDHHWKDNGNIQLILCGSSMSFMERQVLGYKSPLYGRKTGQIKLKAFSFEETREYLQEMDKQSVFEIYGITGGIPLYLEEVHQGKSVMENIQSMFLSKNSLLFEEPANLLKQELENPTNYNSILYAIAQGSSKLNEISTKTQIPTSNLTKFIDNLIALDIVERKTPLGVPNSKNSVYQIKDSMFRFWFRFVSPNISQIELRSYASVEQQLFSQLSDFLGKVFEEVCQEYLWYMMREDKLSTHYTDFGSWWGNNPKEKKQEEIDILGIDLYEKNYLFAECKWRNELVGEKVLRTLVRRSLLFTKLKERKCMVFSKSGFTEEARKYAKEVGILLLSFDEMW